MAADNDMAADWMELQEADLQTALEKLWTQNGYENFVRLLDIQHISPGTVSTSSLAATAELATSEHDTFRPKTSNLQAKNLQPSDQTPPTTEG